MLTRMRSLLLIAFTCAQAVCLCVRAAAGGSEAKGWDKSLTWLPPATLKNLAGNDKPILLFFNQPWCGACNHLKNNLKLEGAELSSLSENFKLINVAGDDNNSFDASYAPDGGYIPRILFAEPNGKLRAEITNPAAGEQHKYFYQNVEMIKAGMESALKVLASSKVASTPETSEL